MSFVPHQYNINAIKTLVHRAFRICHSWISFDVEINRLKTYFSDNGYPVHVFNSVVRRFLNTIFSNNSPPHKEDKIIKYISLPFQGHISYQVRNKLEAFVVRNSLK